MKEKVYLLQKWGSDERIHYFTIEDHGVGNPPSMEETSWIHACSTDLALLKRAIEIDNELVLMEVIPQFIYSYN